MTNLRTKITKTDSNRDLAGEYNPTTIDKAKESGNRLVSISGKFYTVYLANGETLTLNGEREWNKWSKENDYVTDF